MKTAAVLALICWLVPPKHQEHNHEKETDAKARYNTIAQAIDEIAHEDERLQLFLLTVAKHESHYKRKTHNGDYRGDGGWAWGLFQLNLQSSKKDTEIPNTPYTLGDIVGVDDESTYRAVEVAAGMLAPRIARCKGQPRCVFTSYGGLVWADADDMQRERIRQRVRTYRKLVIKRAAERHSNKSSDAGS